MHDLLQESFYLPVNEHDSLHLKRIYKDESGPPVFLLHGSIENGRIFYSESGKGLAPFLARAGFDVFIGDLRGHGKSRPKIDRHATFGQHELICEDIPIFLKAIERIHKGEKLNVLAHSWGGVLLFSFLARNPEYAKKINSIVCFATKRSINVFNLPKFFVINFYWHFLGSLLVKLFGFLPVKKIKFGEEDIAKKLYYEMSQWIKAGSRWVDPTDNFNYAEAIKKVDLPRTLHIVGEKDLYLGHRRDVKIFLEESNPEKSDYVIINRYNNFKRTYGHVDILTHPQAGEDHFPFILKWLREIGNKEEAHASN